MNSIKLYFVFLLCCVFALNSYAKPYPNIIVIYADDLGYGDLGSYGSESNPTPNLDNMAKQGVQFNQFYAGSNICSPSRASLLTGLYPPRAGMPKVLLDSPYGLSDEVTTLAEMLKAKEYFTALVGKWHLGHHKPFLPNNHGFDYFYGTPFSHDMQIDGVLPFYENEEVIETNPDAAWLTNRYTHKTIELIRQSKKENNPFFIYLAHNMPHTPLAVSPAFENKSGAGVYADVIMELDWSVGEILAELKKQSLLENTLVFFSSDNGPSTKQGTHAGSSGPLREGKGTTFEGGHRVPGIFYMPGTVKSKVISEDITSQLDLFPTIAHMVGAELPDYSIDGKNLWATLTEEVVHQRDDFYFFRNSKIEAYRYKKYKLHLEHKYRHADDEFAVAGGPRLKVVQEHLPMSLFDLKNDVGEQSNLLEQDRAAVKEIKIEFKQRIEDFQKYTKQNSFLAEDITAKSVTKVKE